MATATQAVYSVPVQPVQKARPVVSQWLLAEVLRMRQQPTQFDEPLDKAEDKTIYALMRGCEVEAGPLTTWEQTWENPDYEGSFSHLVVVDVAASEGERKRQALYSTPGAWPFPKRIQRLLVRAVA